MRSNREQPGWRVRIGLDRDRPAIYRLRHAVYGTELGQHATNERGELTDALDVVNEYIVAERGGVLAGFVSITPPDAGRYSIDKYFLRSALPLTFDDGLFEVRILTVAPEHRRGPAAGMLMRGALRRLKQAGARQVVIIGRREVAGMYERIGLRPLGLSARSGAVTYDLMTASMEQIDTALEKMERLEARMGDRLLESKPPARRGETACDHGGAFFQALGDRFDRLERKDHIINADVLDAWFDPSPRVVEAVGRHLAWSLRTSPPTGGEGLLATIAERRGVPEECLTLGAGSSALIFLALRAWLKQGSRVLILDPMYGEYAHVLEHVIGARVERLRLNASEGFVLDPERLRAAMRGGYELVVLVNPNNPTGQHVDARVMRSIIEDAPETTRVWIDETYSEYAGENQSLEGLAAQSRNLVTCKSLSKAYALSGARAAYLCGGPSLIAGLRALTPPWAVSLPAQIGAVAALADGAYYAGCWRETASLRGGLASDLRATGLMVIEGVINSVLCRLPGGAGAGALVRACRHDGVFIRDCATISAIFGDAWVRVAVKDEATNTRVVAVMNTGLARLLRTSSRV